MKLTTISSRELITDACGLLNLLAMRREVEIANALDLHLVLPEQASRQVRYLWTPPDEDGECAVEPARVDALVEHERLKVRGLDDDPLIDAFMTAAARIDDADAACIALAGVLNCPLLTDDRKARRIAQEMFPTIQLVSSLSLLHEASRALRWSETELREVALDLFHRGNFGPPRADPLAGWYRALLD